MANGFIQKGKLFKDTPQSQVKLLHTGTQKMVNHFWCKVVAVYINTRKTTFDFNSLFNSSLKSNIATQKQGNKEKLQLFTCKLVFKKGC